MKVCRILGRGQRWTLSQCGPVTVISSSDIAKSLALSPVPQKAVKALGRRLQVNLLPKDVSRAMAGVYVDLQKKRDNPVMATYIRDLYGVGESERYFEQARKAALVVGAKGNPVGVISADTEHNRVVKIPNKSHKVFYKSSLGDKRKTETIVGRSGILGRGYRHSALFSSSSDWENGAEQASVASDLQVAREKAQIIIAAAQKSDGGNNDGSADNPQNTYNDVQAKIIATRINFDTIVKYCLEDAVNYDEIKPVYDMLLELLYGVTDPKWMEAKERIHEHMRKLEYQKASSKTNHVVHKQRQSPTAKSKVTNAVFVYTYQDSSAWKRLDYLRQLLTKKEWLDENTMPEDFYAIFGGEASYVKVKWTGAQSQLYYLIKTLLSRGLIRCPEGQKGHWIIVSNHFVDRNSRTFKDWNKQRDPKRSKSDIESMVDFLDPRLKDLL